MPIETRLQATRVAGCKYIMDNRCLHSCLHECLPMPSSNSANDTKHIKLRGNLWWYQRRVPKSLQHAFENESVVSFSLGTGDIRLARSKRDKFNGELENLRMSSANPNSTRFRQLVRQLKADKHENPYYWDAPYDVREIERSRDNVFVDAYTTVTGKSDKTEMYGVSLKEALGNWQQMLAKEKSAETQRKVPLSVQSFLHFLERKDILLQEINRRHVYDFIEFLGKQYSKATVLSHISRVKTIWKLAKDRCEVSGENPFIGHTIKGTGEPRKHKLLEPPEIRKLCTAIANESLEKQLVFKFGLFTGARLSEICNLKVKHIGESGGVYYYHVEKGKTEDATRYIPIPSHLVNDVKTLCEGRQGSESLFGVTSSSYGQWFSVFKSKQISSSQGKVFHSLRVGFSTALKRCNVRELYAAELLGHKRGTTMSYGYYAKENEIQLLAKEAQKAVDYILNNWVSQAINEG